METNNDKKCNNAPLVLIPEMVSRDASISTSAQELSTGIFANLMLDDVSVDNWCKRVIELQEREYPGYSSLTSPTDLNHVVKKAASEIIDFLKSIGNDSMSAVHPTEGGSRDGSAVSHGKAKHALKVLISYLKEHEVWKPSQEKPLTNEQLDQAYKDLYMPAYTYTRADRKFTDPPIRGQNYALFSFQPTKGAAPDNNGIYGFIKIRGTYNRLEEVEEKSKELIQYFSAHQLFAVEVGTPTPLKEKLENKDMITEIEHRDANHDMDVYTDLVRDQTAKEKQQIEEIKRKTEELKADVQKGPDDKEPLQRYLELVQKRATAAYVYTQHREKLAEYKTVVLATREQIAEMDRQYPNLKDEYLDHYTKTCRETGIDQAVDNMAVMIKQYYAEDPDLGF
jgi:hypothetical protein